MTDYLNHRGQSVAVMHAQGESRYIHAAMFGDLYDKPCSVPDWIGLITCCNVPAMDQAVLIAQLQHNGIRYLNPAATLVNWTNAMKPRLIVDALDAMSHPYVLVLDALDVALNGHFIRAIPGYMKYGKAVLFGATRSNSPDVEIDRIKDRNKRGAFCYLNAGTAFGRREAMAVFYRLVAELADAIQCDREQPLVRHAFNQCQQWVDFDWRCLMFQTLGHAALNVENDAIRVS